MFWCVPPWVQLVWDSLSFLDFLEVYSFARLGRVSFIICSNKFSFSCSSYSPSGTPIIQMLEHLKLAQKFLSLSSFFLNSCFFILFQLNVYFFLLFQIVDLIPGFLPFTVGSCTFSCISLCIAFTSSFLVHPYTIIYGSILITSVLNSASDRLTLISLLSCNFFLEF